MQNFSRRTMLQSSVAFSTLALVPNTAVAREVVAFPGTPLSGGVVGSREIDTQIDALNQYATLIRLANNQTLDQECAKRVRGITTQISTIAQLQQGASGDLSSARQQQLIALVSTGLAGLTSILIAAGSAPVWIVASGVVTIAAGATMAISLAGSVEDNSATDGTLVLTSHFAGRLSILAGQVPRIALRWSFFALALELLGLLRAGAEAALIRRKIGELGRQVTDLKAEASKFSDRTTCRTAILQDVEASVEGLHLLRPFVPLGAPTLIRG